MSDDRHADFMRAFLASERDLRAAAGAMLGDPSAVDDVIKKQLWPVGVTLTSMILLGHLARGHVVYCVTVSDAGGENGGATVLH